MKSTTKLIIFVFTFLALAASAYAQSLREQLQQMVEQLQKTPNDNALRERIIKLAKEVKPPPAINETAERHLARGRAAFKSATIPGDYTDAAREFSESALAAPWLHDAYYNLAVAQDKAGQYEAAMQSLKLATLAADTAEDAKASRELLYEVEYRKERSKAEAEKAAKAKDEETLIVPDVRIGRIRIGMPLSQVEQILGRPESSQGFNDGSPGGTYEYKSFSVVYDQRMEVYRVRTTSSEYKTRAGVAVGSHIDEVRREWGVPLEEMQSKGRVSGEARVSKFLSRTYVDWDPTTGRILAIEVWSAVR